MKWLQGFTTQVTIRSMLPNAASLKIMCASLVARLLAQQLLAVFFAMLNLLGPSDLTLSLDPEFKLPTPLSKSMFTHWYHKTELKPGRKMGHINIKANEVHELQEGINLMKQFENDLWNSFRQR